MKDWKPTANLSALRLRAALHALIRQFFADHEVMEVETPILSAAGNTDANIESFQLQFHGPQSAGSVQRWLRTSPEFALKRLLAAGVGDCYELGRVFRNGEAGQRHNPEFTLLEWYRLGWDYFQLMEECAELIKRALSLTGRCATMRRISYRQLYQDHFGFDPLTASEATLRHPLAEFTIHHEGLTRDDWLDLLMTHLIQPSMSSESLLTIYDYPASQCALAKIREDVVPVAERFELYVGQLEIANGYHELNNAGEQRERFNRDLRLRENRAVVQPPIDEHLLAALPSLPPCSGVALGVDRLMMAMLDSKRIEEVIAFPFDRA